MYNTKPRGYDWQPPRPDMQKFREWHAQWRAEYIRKHGKPPAQLRK